MTTHERWLRPCRSPAIVGSAVETIVWSSDARNIPSHQRTEDHEDASVLRLGETRARRAASEVEASVSRHAAPPGRRAAGPRTRRAAPRSVRPVRGRPALEHPRRASRRFAAVRRCERLAPVVGVSRMRFARPSSGSAARSTRPRRSSCWTFRVTVGVSTPRRSASEVTRSGTSPLRWSLESSAAPARSTRTPAVERSRSWRRTWFTAWAIVESAARIRSDAASPARRRVGASVVACGMQPF